MTRDDVLLELAAKAAGLDVWFNGGELDDGKYRCGMDSDGGWESEWNPLADDGDALRLAVKLGIETTIDIKRGHSWADFNSGTALAKEIHRADAYAATRRAIVRAAAEIGRAMP